MIRLTHRLGLALALVALLAPTARAWHSEGHLYSAVAAVESLPEEMPAFFRDSAVTIGQHAIDPDIHRDRDLPQLYSTEGPEHYFNLERLDGEPVPETRYRFLHLCERLDINPYRTGTAPYAIAELTQRLTLAFAEYRAAPDADYARDKCIVYAGLLAHYAADLQMPLHTSIHHDGRVGDDGESPRTGIHQKVDALPTMMAYNELFAEPLPEPGHAFERGEVLDYILEELEQAHALVDDVYAMEDEIPARGERIESEAVRAFTAERMRAAGSYIAHLYHGAWINSAEITPPPWLDRDAFEPDFDRDTIAPRLAPAEGGD